MDLSTSCTCKVETCGDTLQRLSSRLEVLETTLGWASHANVEESCILIQRTYRHHMFYTYKQSHYKKLFSRLKTIRTGHRALIRIQARTRTCTVRQNFKKTVHNIRVVQKRFREVSSQFSVRYKFIREIRRLEDEIEKDRIIIKRYQSLLASRNRLNHAWNDSVSDTRTLFRKNGCIWKSNHTL